MTLAALLDRRAGRLYFGAQAVAGALWWIGVATVPAVRAATLAGLPVELIAVLDIPLFVFMSALALAGLRGCAEAATAWTVLVTAAMAGYATLTGLAGWGAIAMTAASAGSVAALLLVRIGRLPSEWLMVGPFRARVAAPASTRSHLRRTAAQIVVFWGGALLVVPAVILILERRWGVHLPMPFLVQVLGGALLVAASALGIRSAVVMVSSGDGTPLPSATAARLVVTGPYRFVRNPMAVAGIAQGVAVGMLCESWLVIVYALCGSLVWNDLIRPWEEKDLVARFGDEYERYRQRVSCWIPRRPRAATRRLGPAAASYTDPDV
ncbi:isoprenylcysteine carboxylmethyltransferase family protein [Microbacterium esteraromaticum]|uniref:methyltransferase family protein n=1 Tax=Microbacterium esteraromaticum TaxID=57043 RepID=UPI0030B3EDCB